MMQIILTAVNWRLHLTSCVTKIIWPQISAGRFDQKCISLRPYWQGCPCKIYVMRQAGLLPSLSPGFTIWTWTVVCKLQVLLS